MARYSRARLGTGTSAGARRRLRWIGAATTAALVISLAQIPAGAATDPAPTVSTEQPADEATLAAAQAQASGEPVELVSKETATSTTYVNPDGTNTVEITQEPTRVKQDGEYVDIDTSLSKEGGVLVPAASVADVEISDGLGTGEPLATVSKGAKSLSLDWPADLPAAHLDGAEANFDAGATRDVNVTATADGFNIHILLDQAPAAAPVYRLPITAEGVHLEPDSVGGYAAEDDTGTVRFRIKPLTMWDANPATMIDGNQMDKVAVDSRLVTTADGGQVLELRPDFAWLSDPSRIAPITIDPDVYVDNVGVQDTYIKQALPGTNYSADEDASIGWTGTATASNSRSRMYTQFNLPAVLNSADVVSAKLKLYTWHSASCTPTTVSVYPVTPAWTASNLTWNSTTPTGGPAINTDTVPVAYKGTATFTRGNETCADTATKNNGFSPDIDVTNMVKAWKAGTLTNNGMAVYAYPETDPAAYKLFCTRNTDPTHTSCNSTGKAPTLTITYNTAPATPTDLGVALPSAPCVTGSTRPILPTGVATLEGYSRDPDGDATRMSFEVRTLTGTTALVNGTTAYSTDDSPTVWTLPNALPSGGYRWRSTSEDGLRSSSPSVWCEFTVDTTLAAPHAQVQKFFDAVEEHGVAAGPGPNELSLNATSNGWAAFHSIADGMDADRVAMTDLDHPEPVTAPKVFLSYAAAPSSNGSTTTFHLRRQLIADWDGSELPATPNDISSDEWTVEVESSSGTWKVDSATSTRVALAPESAAMDEMMPIDDQCFEAVDRRDGNWFCPEEETSSGEVRSRNGITPRY